MAIKQKTSTSQKSRESAECNIDRKRRVGVTYQESGTLPSLPAVGSCNEFPFGTTDDKEENNEEEDGKVDGADDDDDDAASVTDVAMAAAEAQHTAAAGDVSTVRKFTARVDDGGGGGDDKPEAALWAVVPSEASASLRRCGRLSVRGF